MTFSELKQLVRRGEGQYLEFKKKADHPDKIVREMVAFANSGGGELLLGVDDNGEITGLKYPDEERYAMEAAMALYIKPELAVIVDSIKTEYGKEVIRYIVPDSEKKPYSWLSDKEKKIYKVYVRQKDQCLQASAEMLKILKAGQRSTKQFSLTFNTREKKVFAFLEENKVMTLDEFARISKIPKWMASRILVQRVIQGIFTIQPCENHDLYSLSPSYLTDIQ
jgi:predicted HTH transcriptional regulator